jgi:uncharacterized membrane protein HdeD (DUF308 family)
MWDNIIRNWQTSGSGIIAAVAGLIAVFYPDKTAFINQVAAGVALLAGLVFSLLAKDGNKSGTAANPNP